MAFSHPPPPRPCVSSHVDLWRAGGGGAADGDCIGQEPLIRHDNYECCCLLYTRYSTWREGRGEEWSLLLVGFLCFFLSCGSLLGSVVVVVVGGGQRDNMGADQLIDATAAAAGKRQWSPADFLLLQQFRWQLVNDPLSLYSPPYSCPASITCLSLTWATKWHVLYLFLSFLNWV